MPGAAIYGARDVRFEERAEPAIIQDVRYHLPGLLSIV